MSKHKIETRKLSLSVAVDEAMSELTSLGEEMRSWEENMSEKLSSTAKYEEVSTAADTLEGIQGADIIERLSILELEIHLPAMTPKQALRQSRASRRDTAVQILDQCVQTLEALETDDEAQELAEELANAKDEAESVDFPGMY